MRVDTKIITNIIDATACAEKWLQQAFDEGDYEYDWNNVVQSIPCKVSIGKP